MRFFATRFLVASVALSMTAAITNGCQPNQKRSVLQSNCGEDACDPRQIQTLEDELAHLQVELNTQLATSEEDTQKVAETGATNDGTTNDEENSFSLTDDNSIKGKTARIEEIERQIQSIREKCAARGNVVTAADAREIDSGKDEIRNLSSERLEAVPTDAARSCIRMQGTLEFGNNFPNGWNCNVFYPAMGKINLQSADDVAEVFRQWRLNNRFGQPSE